MIEVRNLSFGYGNGTKKVLNNISFKAYPGKLTAIIGANGTGKSTMLKNICKLLKGTGEIIYNNVNLNSMKQDDNNSMISYLSQDNYCAAVLSVFEVVLLGRINSLSFRVSEEDLEKTWSVLRRLKIESLASRNIGELSGGQRQLVFIAQALVREPEILVLDEPTSSLDLYYQFEMMELLKELTIEENFVTIVTLHQIDLAARFADEIIVLHEGGIYGVGKPQEMLTADMFKEVYRINVSITIDDSGVPHVMPLSICNEKNNGESYEYKQTC
jgi:iron complex transport system ATP-binding protein